MITVQSYQIFFNKNIKALFLSENLYDEKLVRLEYMRDIYIHTNLSREEYIKCQ